MMNYKKEKLRKQFYLQLHQIKIPRNKFKQGGKQPILRKFYDFVERY